MFSLARLCLPAEADFAKLTFPKYRPLLGGGLGVVAVGAMTEGAPAGLGLAQIGPEPRLGQVLSVAVSPEYRRQGLGATILARLEAELAAECDRGYAVFMGSSQFAGAVQRLLEKRGWGPIRERMIVCHGDVQTMMTSPWVRNMRVRPPFEYFAWKELTLEERQAVERMGYPQEFSPFREEELIADNSVGLRYHGEVVGWIMAHRAFPDTLRYGSLFVKPGLDKMGRGVALIAESLRRHAAGPLAREAPNGVLDIRCDNLPMVRFLHRHLGPLMHWRTCTYGASKELRA